MGKVGATGPDGLNANHWSAINLVNNSHTLTDRGSIGSPVLLSSAHAPAVYAAVSDVLDTTSD